MGGRFSKHPRRQSNGIYKRCRRGALGLTACPGYTTTKNGHVNPHSACGGDGWIKVGEKRKGRSPGRGGYRGRGRRARQRIARHGAGFGIGFLSLGEVFGVVGRVLCVVVYVLFLGLSFVGSRARAGAQP